MTGKKMIIFSEITNFDICFKINYNNFALYVGNL